MLLSWFLSSREQIAANRECSFVEIGFAWLHYTTNNALLQSETETFSWGAGGNEVHGSYKLKKAESHHGLSAQAVDKTNELRRFDESFRPPFSKGGADPTRARWSPVATGETPLSAFLFDNFFFAPSVSKKKWLTDWYNLTDRMPLVYSQSPPAEKSAGGLVVVSILFSELDLNIVVSEIHCSVCNGKGEDILCAQKHQLCNGGHISGFHSLFLLILPQHRR